jgi:hypothetical protein
MRRTVNGLGVAILAHNYARTMRSAPHESIQRRWFSQGPGASAPLEVPNTKSDDLSSATSAPPMPPNYVPVEHRDASDESLTFLRKPSAATLKKPFIPEGCIEAPHLPDRPKKEPRYIDEHAARLKTTSVGAGRPLVDPNSAASFTYEEAGERSQTFHRASTPAEELGKAGGRSAKRASDSFGASTTPDASKAPPQTPEEELGRRMAASIPRTRMDDLRADIQKLDYYQGTPEYMKHLDAFRAKYGDGQKLSIEEGEEESDRRPYSADEISRGLKGEPLDLHRSSHRLQSILTAGPHGYHPDRMMQQYGFASMEAGYAFSPAKIIGQLDAAAPSGSLDANKPDYNLASQELKDQVSSNANEDKSLAFRYLGVNTIQRRQIRMCLSDIDTSDYNSTLHVMMTYPYTDWLFSFYLVGLGFVLYSLQKKYQAYDFYDEYLGLDLRQVRKLEKPLLVLATIVMLFALWQPVTLASIATTRIYRIILGRPIGPP